MILYDADREKNLEDILGSLDRQTLISIILEFADKDKRIKEELSLRYAKGTDILKHARNVIKSAVASVKRRGFVEYRDVSRATEGAYTVLQMSDDKRKADDTLSSVLLCIVVLEEMMDLIDCCDDSNGHVGGAVSHAIGKIEKAVETAPGREEKLFDLVFNHALNTRYDGWTHWRLDLLSVVIPLCENRANRDKMEQYISERQNASTDERRQKYEVQELQKLQYDLIMRFDGEKAAAEFIEQRLGNSDFRRMAIRTAMAGGQYDKALDLCIDGEYADKHSAGLFNRWRELQYEIYEKTGDTRKQKTLGSDFVLNGDFEYFPKLKALYAEDEWPSVLQGILEKLGENDRRGVYVKILLHEKLKLRLLDYCKKHVHAIDSYYTHLLPECRNDIDILFTKYIRERAARAYDRKQYNEVCTLIRHYKEACGKAAYEFRDELAAEYVKRPAFLDELCRV